MKELSIEEKAKVYDEALIIAKQWYNDSDTTKKEKYLLKGMFSELVESENERIRKAIKKALQIKCDGSRIISDEPVTLEEAIAWLEKQAEQNPTNKVEPKFKVGDKVKKGYLTYTVEDIDEDSYKLQAYSKDGNKGCTVFLTIGYEKDYELVEQKPTDKVKPTFKVGDEIQYLKGCGTIMTIEKIENGEYIFGNNMGHTTIESGNKWHLVEKKSAWSEEDEKKLLCVCAWIKDYPRIADFKDEMYTVANNYINWLKSLKGRVQPKQEWSEEDEKTIVKMRDFFIRFLGDKPDFTEDKRYEEFIEFIDNRLKSLRPQKQWKPSEEMLEALYRAIPKNVMEISEDEMLLDKLYQGLKYGRVLSEK